MADGTFTWQDYSTSQGVLCSESIIQRFWTGEVIYDRIAGSDKTSVCAGGILV